MPLASPPHPNPPLLPSASEVLALLLMALEADGEAAKRRMGEGTGRLHGRYWQVCIWGGRGRGVTGEIKEGRVGVQD